MPMFVIGIKDSIKGNNEIVEEAIIKRHIAIEIILNLIIGKSSKLYKKLYEQGLLMEEPYLDYEFDKTYRHITITGKSTNPKKILKNIQEEILNLKNNGIDETAFQRIKKMLYGRTVKEFTDVSDICRMF